MSRPSATPVCNVMPPTDSSHSTSRCAKSSTVLYAAIPYSLRPPPFGRASNSVTRCPASASRCAHAAGRPRADHRDLAARVRRTREAHRAGLHRPIGCMPLQRADRDGLRILVVAHACAFAQDLGRTHAGTHPAERIRRQDVGRGALQVAVADLADEARDVDLRRAGLHARRVVAVVAAAGGGRRGSRIEQRRDVGEFARVAWTTGDARRYRRLAGWSYAFLRLGGDKAVPAGCECTVGAVVIRPATGRLPGAEQPAGG